MENKSQRSLTEDELKILGYIRDLYGVQNSSDDVFFTDDDDAAIFVKDIYGTKGMCVVLTNVAKFSKKDNLTRDEICKQYLIP